MATITRTSFSTGDVLTDAEWNTQFDTIYNEFNGNIDATNLDTTFNNTIAKLDEAESVSGAWSFGATAGITATGGYTGPINTAAQTNITSVGTLTSLAVAGDITLTGAQIDIDLKDNDAGALSIDTSGLTGLIAIDTANGAEVVSMAANFRPNNGINTSAGGTIWQLADNNANSLSIDAAGATGLILIDTTNGSEGVTMSGFLGVTGDIYTAADTDYSASSTITGWSSTTADDIHVKKVGKTVFVSFNIDGTSNSTSVSFTVPYAAQTTSSTVYRSALAVTYDNGAYDTEQGSASIASGSSTVNCNSGQNGSWTASGSKQVSGQLWYETA